MQVKEDLYTTIIESMIEGEETALNTIVLALTNLKHEPLKIEWIIDCLQKIKEAN